MTTHTTEESWKRYWCNLRVHKDPPTHILREERLALCSSDNNFTSPSVTLFTVRIQKEQHLINLLISLLSHLPYWTTWYFTALYQKVLYKYYQLMLKRRDLWVASKEPQGGAFSEGRVEGRNSAFHFASVFVQTPKLSAMIGKKNIWVQMGRKKDY